LSEGNAIQVVYKSLKKRLKVYVWCRLGDAISAKLNAQATWGEP